MKKLPYIHFVETNKWFRERPHERKNFQAKISRVANSVQNDVVAGPAFDLLSLEEQHLIRDAAAVLDKLKEKIDDAKKHVIWLQENSEYQKVTPHREKYRKLIREKLSIDEKNLQSVLEATLVILYLNNSNITDSEKYVRLIENGMRTGKYSRTTPLELSKYIQDRYIYEVDQFAYKFYNNALGVLDYELLKERLDIPVSKKADLLKLYATFFSRAC